MTASDLERAEIIVSNCRRSARAMHIRPAITQAWDQINALEYHTEALAQIEARREKIEKLDANVYRIAVAHHEKFITVAVKRKLLNTARIYGS